MPAITTFSVDLCMTGFTQRNQVISVVCTTFCQWHLVMHLFGGDKSSILLAQFTHWVLLHIGIPYPLPYTSVATPSLRISVVLLVPLSLSLGVFLTEPSVGKPWTAREGTGSLGFTWHGYPPS